MIKKKKEKNDAQKFKKFVILIIPKKLFLNIL